MPWQRKTDRESVDTESDRSVSCGLVPVYHVKADLVREAGEPTARHALSRRSLPDNILVVPSVDQRIDLATCVSAKHDTTLDTFSEKDTSSFSEQQILVLAGSLRNIETIAIKWLCAQH